MFDYATLWAAPLRMTAMGVCNGLTLNVPTRPRQFPDGLVQGSVGGEFQIENSKLRTENSKFRVSSVNLNV